MPEKGTESGNQKTGIAKTCEKCGAGFTCQPENITACQCYTAPLNTAARKHLTTTHKDCLCRKCLDQIAARFKD